MMFKGPFQSKPFCDSMTLWLISLISVYWITALCVWWQWVFCPDRKTLSNHRIPEQVSSEELLDKSLCSSLYQLQQVAQECVQFCSEYLQDRRLHNAPEEPDPVFDPPHRRKSFCMFKRNPVFQFDSVNEVGPLKEQCKK